jgi:hypothetical protein
LSPKAVVSGGQETFTSGGFTYYVFTATGTLTVSTGGLVDVLSTGGGGGGGAFGGGGGAGELDIWTPCTVSSDVTAGGAGAVTSNFVVLVQPLLVLLLLLGGGGGGVQTVLVVNWWSWRWW